MDVQRLVTEITQKIRREETVESIVRATLEGVASHFPAFDTSYATADREGFTGVYTIFRGGKVDDSTRRFDVPLPQDYLDFLRGRHLIVVTDIATSPWVGALGTALAAAKTKAYLSAPITHIDGQIGLLAVHSEESHVWTDEDKTTVRNAADVLAVAVDDATRRQQLRESEEKFRLLAEQSNVNISLVQRSGIVYANPTMQRMTGYTEAELLDLDYTELIHPDYRDVAQEWTERRFAGEALEKPLELRIVAKDGTERWIEFQGRTIELGGKPTLLSSGIETTKRRQAEEMVLESEARLRSVLDQLGDGVSVVAEGKIVYVNPTLCQMFGYDASDLLGQDPIGFLAPHTQDQSRTLMRQQARGDRETGQPDQHDVSQKDGRLATVETITRRVDYGGGAALLTTVRDLTARRRAEQAVLEAEAKYRSLIENSLVGVYIIQDQRFVYCNPKMAEIFGYTADELFGLSSVLDLVTEDDKPSVAEHLHSRLAGSTSTAQYHARIRRKDGAVTHVEVLGSLTEYEGQPAIIGTCLDITERMRRDEAVKESEQRFRTLFEQAPIGIVIASSDTTFISVNSAFCEMLGYREPELIGKSFVDVTHPDDLGGTPESAKRVLEDATSVTRFNKRYIRKDGSTVQAETTVSLVRAPSGHLLYALAMIEDITERRQLEAQLQQMQRLESIGQLAGGVAHNFNNALTAIYGYAELLSRRLDANDPSYNDLEQIKRVAEQSADLTRQLLAFSRKEQVRLSVFCLNEVVTSTRDLLAPILGARVDIVLELTKDLSQIRSDRGQMEQVVTNLILNARDAMPSGGTLTVRTAAASINKSFVRTHPEGHAGEYVRLTVSDTGLGMDDETLGRVFEPFFTTKEQGKGVGLGLAMVHGAVRQSGGFVTVSSTIGVGTSFDVYLPVHDLRTGPDAPVVDAPATL